MEKWITLIGILAAVGIPAFILIRMAAGALAARRIQETGKRASGFIDSIRQTGTYVNEQPQVEFLVRVEPPGEPVFVNGDDKVAELRVKVLPPGSDPFDSAIHGVFKPEGLFKYQPGKGIPVRYDPRERSIASVDYSRASVERVD